MLTKPTKKTIFFIWLGWAVLMIGYQVLIPARFKVMRPDRALNWTASETAATSQRGKIYLLEPFMNTHVSWDSEFYLAIALGGYEDPNIRRVGDSIISGGANFWPFVMLANETAVRPGLSLSYAFFPFYPLTIRALSVPLSLLGMNPIATATLAGVIISLLGSLAAALALFQIGKQELGEEGGLRTAVYLLIFPSSIFLAQVYTEGLFVGLAFSSLLLLRRGNLGWAVLLAVCATFTRAVGVTLVIPLLLHWLKQGEWLDLDMEWRQLYFKGVPWRIFGRVLLILAPVIAFGIWRLSYFGMAFSQVEETYFGRGLLSFGNTYTAWSNAWNSMFGENLQATAYYLVEFGAIVLGFVACLAGLRRYPDLALFGLLVVFLSFTSGPAQGMHRYVLAAPPIFLFLAQLGSRPAFDRVWSIGSTLLLSMVAIMFMFDMWAG